MARGRDDFADGIVDQKISISNYSLSASVACGKVRVLSAPIAFKTRFGSFYSFKVLLCARGPLGHCIKSGSLQASTLSYPCPFLFLVTRSTSAAPTPSARLVLPFPPISCSTNHMYSNIHPPYPHHPFYFRTCSMLSHTYTCSIHLQYVSYVVSPPRAYQKWKQRFQQPELVSKGSYAQTGNSRVCPTRQTCHQTRSTTTMCLTLMQGYCARETSIARIQSTRRILPGAPSTAHPH